MLTRISRIFPVAPLIATALSAQTGVPQYSNDPQQAWQESGPGVHDPSVIKVGDSYYVFGSHVAAAKTDDLMNWTQISGDGVPNTLIDLESELEEEMAWAMTATLWAPDHIQLGDGRFYMYYCASKGDEPRAVLGRAVSDNIEGPYVNLGVFLRSGDPSVPTPNGSVFNANIHPHVIDPHVFFDPQGKLWMVYGSYSGGIFILELDPEDGLPLPGQNFGKHLWGGNHARIEGPYILYNPDTEYYYLFISYGGLDAVGSYHIRVARSRTPDGPYLDAAGVDMSTVKGRAGSFFDDESINPHGVTLMVNNRFLPEAGEPLTTSTGYVSPGHNSAYYDEENDKYYLFFHTRFVGRGEVHEVRVHQIYFNEDAWPVVAPHRYAHETLATHYHPSVLHGEFKVIVHDRELMQPANPDEWPKFVPTVNESEVITLNSNGTVSGGGNWELNNGHNLRITLGGTEYRGVVSHQWDYNNRVWVNAFSALSADGMALWGSQVAENRTSIEAWRKNHFGNTANSGAGADLADPDGDGAPNLVEYALRTDPNDARERGPTLFLDEDRLTLVLDRLMDPALTYTVEGSDDLQSWSDQIWSSTGNENVIGPVWVNDSEDVGDSARFLRVRVER